ncbi:hypothetical protein [Streptomyces sp. NPDC002952]|uniref:hypothetical protein n=1 Tax=Streptomyces sp. NPDC002952 TaxID=3364673 RepID=UPI0036B9ED8A
MTGQPIIPTRVFPAGEGPQALPEPVAPPPPPPPPPAPPTVPDPDPDWFGPQSGVGGPAPHIEIHHHYYPAEPAGGWLILPDPEPGPRWWQRIRIGYNAALIFLSMPLTGPWCWVLAHVRDEASLAGAWVMAAVPLAVLAFIDNAKRAEEAGADPNLWAPKIRAAVARLLLWAAVIATGLTLPITTLVYLMTGVKPS